MTFIEEDKERVPNCNSFRELATLLFVYQELNSPPPYDDGVLFLLLIDLFSCLYHLFSGFLFFHRFLTDFNGKMISAGKKPEGVIIQ